MQVKFSTCVSEPFTVNIRVRQATALVYIYLLFILYLFAAYVMVTVYAAIESGRVAVTVRTKTQRQPLFSIG